PETVEEQLGPHLVALVQGEEAGVAFPRAACTGQAHGAEERAENGGARGESGADALGEHPVAHALRRAARLVKGEAERIGEARGIEAKELAWAEAPAPRAHRHR